VVHCWILVDIDFLSQLFSSNVLKKITIDDNILPTIEANVNKTLEILRVKTNWYSFLVGGITFRIFFLINSIKNKNNRRKTVSRDDLLEILKDASDVKHLEISGNFLGFQTKKIPDMQLKNLQILILNGSAISSRISKILNNDKPRIKYCSLIGLSG
jgi:hypothetical protein